MVSPGCGQSAFCREFLLKYPYDERIRRYEDAELLTRLLENAVVYSTNHPTMIHNNDYAEASLPRKDVHEDFFAYLDFNYSNFWKNMCNYRFFLEERILYPDFGRTHYKKMYFRYDLLLLYKALVSYNKIIWKIKDWLNMK